MQLPPTLSSRSAPEFKQRLAAFKYVLILKFGCFFHLFSVWYFSYFFADWRVLKVLSFVVWKRHLEDSWKPEPA